MYNTDKEFEWKTRDDGRGNEVRVRERNHAYVKPSSPSKMKFYKR